MARPQLVSYPGHRVNGMLTHEKAPPVMAGPSQREERPSRSEALKYQKAGFR